MKRDVFVEEYMAKDFDNSSFRVTEVEETRNSTIGIAILRNPKS
jgi:hypothetical protein